MPTITLPPTVNTRDTIWTLLVKWGRGNPLTANWTDSIAQSSIAGGIQIFNATQSFSMPITLATGGHAIAMRIFLGNVGYNGDGLKLGIFTAGGSLIASTSATINISDSNTLKVAPLTSTAISAGSYLLAFSINSTGTDTIRTNAATVVALAYNTSFAAFPPATLPGSSAFGGNFMIGVQVQ